MKERLSTYLGHVTLTLNLYGHVLPRNEDEAAGLLDAYLGGQTLRRGESHRRFLSLVAAAFVL